MSDFLLDTPFLALLFLFGSLSLTVCSAAILHLGKFKSKEFFKSKKGPLFFFRPLLKKFSPKNEWENLYFILSFSKHIYQLSYGVFAFFYLFFADPIFHQDFLDATPNHEWIPLLLVGGGIIFLSFILDFSFRLLATFWSRPLLKAFAPFASLYLLFLFPLSALFVQLTKKALRKADLQEEEVLTDKFKIREIIRESELQEHLDPSDQKLISSFVHFKQRVVKEIMVPRVDLFSLDAKTTLLEATKLFSQEGYSRIPIHRERLDQIVGVALYKDLLKCYALEGVDLKAPLESIAKPVLYAPENKKISHLLQEFRTKQIHMAIVVDEYGGTEGIVTIEDILEELVGEIEDESDVIEEHQFWELPDGGWIVDSKMTIHDIEEKLGISIPESPEYETIGGYIFHIAGTIPPKNWRLTRDEFDLEVLSSNERAIKKIKIVPR